MRFVMFTRWVAPLMLGSVYVSRNTHLVSICLTFWRPRTTS